MLATAINAWLKGPGTYLAGLQLLEQVAAQHPEAIDDTDLWFLRLGETSLSREQLHAALLKQHAAIVRAAQVIPERPMPQPVLKAQVSAHQQQQGRDVTSDGYGAMASELPPALRALRDQVREWALEMNFLRRPERMESLPTDAERLRDAMRIVELDQMIVSAYARLDAWRDTGRDPGETGPATAKTELNGVQLVKELKNIESYLSRAQKRGSSPAKVKQWQERRDKLKALIDAVPA